MSVDRAKGNVSQSVGIDASYANGNDLRKSHTKVSTQSFGNVIALDAVDGRAFRDWFLNAFARYLQMQFRSPEEVAVAFGVRMSTATNWWNADNRASGDAVARAFMSCPDAIRWFLQEWQE